MGKNRISDSKRATPAPPKVLDNVTSNSPRQEEFPSEADLVMVHQCHPEPPANEQKVDPTDVKRLNRKRKAPSLAQAFDEQVRPYIDLIDNLRAYGLDKDVGLPAVAVIGDQSSGKSSTLEAISGIQLPRGSGIVTRCPLELRMKCHPTDDTFWSSKIFYKDRSGNQCEDNIPTPEAVESAVRAAQDAMTEDQVGISDELITLEVTSSTVPDLTLIDLPGITRVAMDGQPEDIGEQIKRLIEHYIKRQETIILVVIPSNVDIATIEALKLSQWFDPQGDRSLGVLTKPDLIDKGAEAQVFKAVSNQAIPLKKGYTIVKCRGQAAVDDKQSLQEALIDETNFFERHEKFRNIPRYQRGILSLSRRLTWELVEQIKRVVPELKMDVKVKLEETRQELRSFREDVPNTTSGRQAALFEVVSDFNSYLLDAARGNYVSRNGNICPGLRLMTVVRRRFDRFGEAVKEKAPAAWNPELKKSIAKQIDEHRGRELPNFNTYEVFEAIMRDMVKETTEPGLQCLDDVDKEISYTLEDLCEMSFARFPKIMSDVKAILSDLRTSARDACKDELSKQFAREELIYSQDTTYLRELDAVSQDTVLYRAKTIDKQMQADHVFSALRAYFSVCSRRVMDMVPMIIRHQMLEVLVKRISAELAKFAANLENANNVLEDPSVSERREDLRSRENRLLRAEEKLNRF